MAITPEQMSLKGRVAVVTGAAMGIGEATALALAAFGADVAVCDRDADNLAATVASIDAQGRHTSMGVLDVRNGEAFTAWIDGVATELGAIDILVNNAGGGFHSPFLDIRAKGQAALVDENFTSVTHGVRAVVPHMPSAGGSIINVTSVEAFRAAPGFSIYAAMKAAVEQLTRTLALELADRRIRVNCVAPDAIPTPGDAGLVDAVRGDDDGGIEGYATAVPLGLGTPDDCAAAIAFLATDLSTFMTGTTLHVDGGSNAARGWRRQANGAWRP